MSDDVLAAPCRLCGKPVTPATAKRHVEEDHPDLFPEFEKHIEAMAAEPSIEMTALALMLRRSRDLESRVAELEGDTDEYDTLLTRLRELLTGVANALKGEPPANVWHDWSDLPAVAGERMARIDQLERLLHDLAAMDSVREVVGGQAYYIDECMFCGANSYSGPLVHDETCVWLRAKQIAGHRV